MLRLIMGRRDRDPESLLLSRLTRREPGGMRYLIVPEQASHEAERALCAAGGDDISTRAEVLSFTRLAGRVFAAVGGTAEPVLDAGGRVLLLSAALKEVSAALKVYARPSRKPAFLERMLDTIDELKCCAVTPEALAQAGEGVGKLTDLALIYGAYDALTRRVAADPRDRLTRLAEALEKSGWAAGKEFYLAGFTDFTPQERRVLSALMEDAGEVTVALLCDRLEGGDSLFDPARRTAHRLLRLARKAGRESEVEYPTQPISRPSELAHLERELFADPPRPWPGAPERVALFRADSPRSEVEWAAAELRRLTREEGLRFRDIVVAARSFDTYQALVETVFPQYGLPVFTSAMTDILEKPVLAVVSGALDVLEGGWAAEDLFRYLKTGLAGLDPDEVDRLENYVEVWDIRGSKWTGEKDWRWRPDGQFGACDPEDPELMELNTLRRRVTAPLIRLKQSGAKTGREQATALFAFLEEIDLPQRLTRRAGDLARAGQGQKAEEYRQLWDILCGALDQCAVILRETAMDLEEFGQVLKLVLSQYDVGAIPVSLDRVTAGELPRVSGRQCRVLCLLGADEGSIPRVSQAAGLLTDQDRELLAQRELELAATAADKLDREWTILYEGCTRPSERLLVFWPARSTDGGEKRSSVLVERLRRAFPELKPHLEGEWSFRLTAPLAALQTGEAAAWPALEALPGLTGRVARMKGARELTRGALSPVAVEALYGKRIPMSASRLDKFKSCHFSYFMEYGLKAKARKRSGFAAPEYGTFVHYVLEQVLRSGGARLEKADRDGLVRKSVERYVAEELGGLEHQTPRFVYLFRRLEKTVLAVVDNAVEELRASDFQPIAFELGFGTGKELPPVTFRAGGVTVSLSGFVDRVDGWEKDGRLYLRVVDYKTGRKSFDWSDVFHGMGLQMLVYLAALEKEGAPLFGREVVPAGVLYLPAREALASGRADMDEKAVTAELEKALRRKGVVLDEPEVLEAMEHAGEGDYRFLPLRVSARTGAVTGEALVSAERLGRLERHVEKVLTDLTAEMARGAITADPFWRGESKNACLYCDYAAACQFREGVGGDRRRPMKSMKQAQFWAAMDGKEGEQDGL